MTIAQKRAQSSKPVHYKSMGVSDLTVDENSRTISGYAAIWGNVDDAGDMLIKGCCSKSITDRGPASTTNRKIIFLWMHDMCEPLGKITVLKEDDKGLYFEAVVDKIPEGDRAIEQAKSGTLNQFSIGYQYVWNNCEWDSSIGEYGAFIVKEINLFEISIVSLGCNDETEFTGMKNLGQIESERNKLMRDTESALKGLPYDTAFTIRQLIAKHISLTEAEPVKPTPPEGEPSKKSLSGVLKNITNALNN